MSDFVFLTGITSLWFFLGFIAACCYFSHQRKSYKCGDKILWRDRVAVILVFVSGFAGLVIVALRGILTEENMKGCNPFAGEATMISCEPTVRGALFAISCAILAFVYSGFLGGMLLEALPVLISRAGF